MCRPRQPTDGLYEIHFNGALIKSQQKGEFFAAENPHVNIIEIPFDWRSSPRVLSGKIWSSQNDKRHRLRLWSQPHRSKNVQFSVRNGWEKKWRNKSAEEQDWDTKTILKNNFSCCEHVLMHFRSIDRCTNKFVQMAKNNQIGYCKWKITICFDLRSNRKWILINVYI